MTKDSDFKVFCDSINEVLSVKALTSPELEKYRQEAYTRIRKSVSVDLYKYHTRIVLDFIVDGKDILKKCEEQVKRDYGEDFEEVFGSITESIYLSVVQVYPNLALENIVQNLNQNTIKGFLNLFLEDLYDQTSDKKHNKANKGAKGERGKSKTKEVSLETLEDIQSLEATLRKNVIGQDEAITTIIRYVKLLVTKLATNISLLFIGPTGCGKTLISKELGKHYSGNFFKINCAEYALPHEYAKLIGSPPGYVASQEKSILEMKAEKSNKWILLFDEIEKADPKLFDFMLALMDEGKVMASNGKELDFSQSIILMTSNEGIKNLKIGSKNLGFESKTITYSSSKETIEESVKNKFNPEFLGRVDQIVHFNQLSKEDLLKVVKLEIKNLPIRKTKALLDYIVKNGTSEEYGARFISKFITREVKSILADNILGGIEPKKGKLYSLKVKDNKLEL